jgi:hypothetical protein
VNRTGCKVHKRTGERCMMKCEVMYRFAICWQCCIEMLSLIINSRPFTCLHI